jgi:hypothetical protein
VAEAEDKQQEVAVGKAAAAIGSDGSAAGPATSVGGAAGLSSASSVNASGRVVRLDCMVERDELLDDEEYEDIVEDTREEVAKYGALKQVGGNRGRIMLAAIAVLPFAMVFRNPSATLVSEIPTPSPDYEAVLWLWLLH